GYRCDPPARGHQHEHLGRSRRTLGGDTRRRLAAVVIEAVEGGPLRLDRIVVAEEGLIEQLRDGQLTLPRERMTSRRNDGPWLHTDRLHAHPRIDRGCVAEGDVHVLEPGRGGAARERE